MIEKISAESIPFDRVTNLTLVKGGGRTLMPGLIAMHWHAMLVRPMPAELIGGAVGYLNLVAGAEAKDTLLRGFTTVRDLGGPQPSASIAPSTRESSLVRAFIPPVR